MAELCTFYSRRLFCTVSDPAKQHPAGPDTLPNKVLRGIKLRGTTFKYEYFREFGTEFKNILGCEFKDYMGLIPRKKQR
jgi:hypothetical protein